MPYVSAVVKILDKNNVKQLLWLLVGGKRSFLFWPKYCIIIISIIHRNYYGIERRSLADSFC